MYVGCSIAVHLYVLATTVSGHDIHNTLNTHTTTLHV